MRVGIAMNIYFVNYVCIAKGVIILGISVAKDLACSTATGRLNTGI